MSIHSEDVDMDDADPDYSDGSSNSDEVESSELTDPDSTDEVDTTKDVDLEEDVDLMEVDTAGPDDADSKSTADEGEPSSSDEKAKGKGRHPGIDRSLAPLSRPQDVFEDMVTRVPIAGKKTIRLRVATVCSGTDAPLIALGLLDDAFVTMGQGKKFVVDHVFSCEIEPFKQGFIRRNVESGVLIFRDVVELASGPEAMTAGGFKAKVPKEGIDLFFAGCSCVDYSNMNTTQSEDKSYLPPLHAYFDETRNKSVKEQNSKVHPARRDPKFVANLKECIPLLNETIEGSGKGQSRRNVGESTRTFIAALLFIAEARPKTVILENVSSAPWTPYQRFWFPKVGYVAKVVMVDSKNYYLPQTRQRGYLIAVDAQHFGVDVATKLAGAWAKTMENCQRRASACVNDFLLPADHPTTVLARAEMTGIRTNTFKKTPEWNKSWLRHVGLRKQLGVPYKAAPFSAKMMEGGRVMHAVFPQHSWRDWWHKQPARIVDSVDLILLGGLKQGCDLRYKTAVCDVSQNADRCFALRPMPSFKFGVIGCITPSGLSIVTDRMRPVTGMEVLALQGMPVERLELATETHAELTDLAGNAMTVTVVGAAALSIFAALGKVPDRNFFTVVDEADDVDMEDLSGPRAEWEDFGSDARTPDDCVLEDLRRLAASGRRLCECNCTILPHLEDRVWYRCKSCGETACAECKGNPPHDYAEFQPDEKISLPSELAAGLKKKLPPMFTLRLDPDDFVKALGSLKPIYRDVVLDILSHSNVFYFKGIHATKDVTAVYESQKAVARLVVSPGTVQVLVFIPPSHQDRAGLLKEGFDLDHQPIAKGVFFAEQSDYCGGKLAISSAPWSVWIHQELPVDVGLSRSNDEDEDEDALRIHHISIPKPQGTDPLNVRQVAQLEQGIRHALMPQGQTGCFVREKRCGTALNLLHIMAPSQSNNTTVFLFKHCTHTGNVAQDGFVFASTCRALEKDEYRDVVLRLKPHISPLDITLLKAQVAFVSGFWVGGHSMVPLANDKHGTIKANVFDTGALASSAVVWDSDITTGSTSAADVLMSVVASLQEFPVSKAWKHRLNAEYLVPRHQQEEMLAMFAAATLGIQKPEEAQTTAEPDHPSRRFDTNGQMIDKPDADTLKELVPPRVYLMMLGGHKGTRRLVESTEHTEEYETLLAKSSDCFTIQARLYEAGPLAAARGADSQLVMRLRADPGVLAKRAISHLLETHRNDFFLSGLLLQRVQVSFRIQMNYTPLANPTWTPFRHLVPDADNRAGLTDILGDLEELANFIETPKDFETTGHEVWDDQLPVLKWMILRELRPEDMWESAQEEHVVPSLGIRFAATARFNNCVGDAESPAGGVLCAGIGFGKTVVVLALLAYMAQFDQLQSITFREQLNGRWREHLAKTPAKTPDGSEMPDNFFIHTTATLIIVPAQIGMQWEHEIDKFLGISQKSGQVIVLCGPAAYSSLIKLTAEDIKAARVVIVDTAIFDKPGYHQQWKLVSCRDDMDLEKLRGRHFQVGYEEMVENIRSVNGVFANSGLSAANRFLAQSLRTRTEEDLRVLESTHVAPSSRKGRAQPQEPAGRKTTATVTKDLGKWKPTSALENFSFARIVWDEYSYENERVSMFVRYACANSKWLLSGTPRLSSMADICSTASNFGMHVSTPDPCTPAGLPKTVQGPRDDQMTDSEKFRKYSGSTRSIDMVDSRYLAAKQLVEHLYRGATASQNNVIERHEKVITIIMSPARAARYHIVLEELLRAHADLNALSQESLSLLDEKSDARVLRTAQSQDIQRLVTRLLARVASGSLPEAAAGNPAVMREMLELRRAKRAVLEFRQKFLIDKLMFLCNWQLDMKTNETPAKATKATKATKASKASKASKSDKSDESDKASKASKAPNADKSTIDSARSRFEGFIAGYLKGDLEQDYSNHDGKELFDRDLSIFAHGTADVASSITPTNYHEWCPRAFVRKKSIFGPYDFFCGPKPPLAGDAWIKASDNKLFLEKDMAYYLALTASRARELAGSLASFWDQTPDAQELHSVRESIFSALPANLAGNVVEKVGVTDLKKTDVNPLFSAWYRRKKEPPRMDADFKEDYSRAELVQEMQAVNLKTSSASLEKMKMKLWAHERKSDKRGDYRDGRGSVHTYDSLPVTPKGVAEAINDAFSYLERTRAEVTTVRREVRFLESFSPLAEQTSSTGRCAACLGPDVEPAANGRGPGPYLLPSCGHVLCGNCCRQIVVCGECPARHCTGYIPGRPIMDCSPRDDGLATAAVDGKLSSIMDLINNVIPAEDKILLFVQFAFMASDVMRLLENAGIKYTNMVADSRVHMGARLEKFKAAKGGRVLLLDIDSEASAGSNLTIANHVIFAAPYQHEDEHHRLQTVTQAMGRCLRPGQTKKVTIWHMFMADTIEEEALRGLIDSSQAVKDHFARGPVGWAHKYDASAQTQSSSLVDSYEANGSTCTPEQHEQLKRDVSEYKSNWTDVGNAEADDWLAKLARDSAIEQAFSRLSSTEVREEVGRKSVRLVLEA